MTKRTESRGKRKHEPWQGATRALLLGCLAELYLLLIHKCYIYGTLDQVLSWYSYLKVSVWLGLAAAGWSTSAGRPGAGSGRRPGCSWSWGPSWPSPGGS